MVFDIGCRLSKYSDSYDDDDLYYLVVCCRAFDLFLEKFGSQAAMQTIKSYD